MAGRAWMTVLTVTATLVVACGGPSATPTPVPPPSEAPPPATPATASLVPAASPAGAAAVEGVEWLLAQMSDGSEMAPVPPGIEVTLTMIDGIAAGWTGCNDYRGPYTIDGQGLVFGEMASTVKDCADAAVVVESNYLQSLPFVARFGVRETGLLLVSPPGAPLLAFAPRPSGSIVGDWVLSEMQNAQGAILPPVAGTPITTAFKEDGTLTGNDGCNDYSAVWRTDGPQVAITSVTGTRTPCPSTDLSDQEAQFLTMLQASTIWTVSEGMLTFRGSNGIVTLVYARDGGPGPSSVPGSAAPPSPAAS